MGSCSRFYKKDGKFIEYVGLMQDYNAAIIVEMPENKDFSKAEARIISIGELLRLQEFAVKLEE